MTESAFVKSYWRAGCSEMGTSGSEGACWKSAVRVSGSNSPACYPTLLAVQNGRTYQRLSDIPAPERERAKAQIANFVQSRFQGMVLTTAVTDNNRVITRTERGNLFGYVQRDHELYAIRHDQWRIAWACAVDGNVLAILQPA